MPIIADVSASTGPTRDELVTEIIHTAQGYSLAEDQVVTLASELAADGLEFTVSGELSRGVVEIGDELINIASVDASTGTCTVHPWGRGWQGSTPAAHSSGDAVAIKPVMPRHRTATVINDIISSLYPQVFGVATVDVVTTATFVEVPADAEFVLDVRYEDSRGEWQRVRRWETENASSPAETTGKAVWLPTLETGTTARVVYAVRPEPLASGTSTWSETGLSIGLKDVVTLGVLARFAQTLDLGRFTDRFTTARGDTQQPQITAGFQMARALRADYQAALDREAQSLRNLYPARVHFVR